MMRRQRSNPADPARSMGPIFGCFVLIFTAQAASLVDTTSGAQTQTKGTFQCPRGCARTQAGHNLWTVRGGYQSIRSSSSSSRSSNSSIGSSRGQDTLSNRSVAGEDHEDVPRGGTATMPATADNHHNIEKLAADLRAKKEHIATHIHDRKEAFAADLKAKQEKIADEVLRERSPEAFGELGGHASSYDSATAGMDVANRRSFFLGIRRIVLLAQVVELLAACIWQTAFPYGGVAGFFAAAAGGTAGGASKAAQSSLRDIIVKGAGDGRGQLGLAVAASFAQFSLYTMLLVWFGCDRVVLRAVRVTGWEHGAAAAWALTRLVAGPGGKLSHLAACTWLAGMAFLCAYFGRQL